MKKLSLRNLMKERKKKGFTLVELIIVIAIIAILVAIAIPKFGQITRNANIKADMATAKNLHGIAAQILAEDPTITDLDAQVATRVDGGSIPNAKTTGEKFHIIKNASEDIEVYGNGSNSTGGADMVYPEQGTTFGGTKTTTTSNN